MKYHELSAGVVKNSNRVLSSSAVNWANLRPGSFVRFGEDDVFYNVFKTTKLSFIKEFEVVNPRQIVIKGDPGSFLFGGDTLTMSFKEYSFGTLLAIPNAGKGYNKGDSVFAFGGYPAADDANQPLCVKFEVTEVDHVGGITQLSIVDHGRYLRTPPTTMNIGGGYGSDAVIEGDFTLNDSRGKIEREIEWIDPDPTKGVIKLNYPLPFGLIQGNLSIEKWEMILTGPYLGETKSNLTYEVHRDFTPHIYLPMLARHSRSLDLLFNQAMIKIDSELHQLKEELKRIKP